MYKSKVRATVSQSESLLAAVMSCLQIFWEVPDVMVTGFTGLFEVEVPFEIIRSGDSMVFKPGRYLWSMGPVSQ